MATIQWRPEVNALTTPQSYRVRYLPRRVIGDNELAAEIVERNPTLTEEVARTVLDTRNVLIQEHLINGDQVTEEEAFTYRLSFTARLDEPDAPLPNTEDMLKVRVYASNPFTAEVRHKARMERLPLAEKAPVIASAEDNRLKLNDVLYSAGVLKLTGSNLLFDDVEDGGSCVIRGTRDGEAAQEQYALITNTSILVVPDIPAQTDPWNNEYTVSVSTRYTEHGTLRTGTFRRRLRSPLLVAGVDSPPPIAVGILTGGAASPYVTVTGGTADADETLRVQAVLDLHEGHLLLNLLDMRKDGESGPAVTVTADGDITLSGFAGSSVDALNLTVNNFAELAGMIRNDYSGRLVDILNISV